LLFVFGRVVSARPEFKKTWLLHGVNPPSVDQDLGQEKAKDFPQASTFRFRDGSGEVLVHSLLPRERVITRRGGPGAEFVAPGDDHGSAWGSGENWPLEPPEGAPLPEDPKARRMWKTFWGEDFDRILSSNRKNVVPGAWRIEVSPSVPSEEDLFLHVLEIGNLGKIGGRRTELVEGFNFVGAACEDGPCVLFGTSGSPVSAAEASLPEVACNSLIVTSLQADAIYELNFTGPNVSSSATSVLPGILADVVRLRANSKGVLRVEKPGLGNLRLRISRI
jgi:heparin/heparan-sulfate lyase